MTNETVSKWFKVVGSTANEQCLVDIKGFEGKAGEFDRHLALVLNKLEG